jgi:membrane-associated protease RseP (regulator of RpoE activity)
MKRRIFVLPLAAAVLAGAPAAAQEECTCMPRAAIDANLAWESDEARARVQGVGRGGPAERAGVRAGDVVVTIAGEPATRAAVARLTAAMQEGDTVRLRVQRDGAEEEVAVVAARRPAAGRQVWFDPGRETAVRIEQGARTMVVQLDSLATRIDTLSRAARLMQVQEHLEAARRIEDGVRVLEGARIQIRGVSADSAGAMRIEMLPGFLERGARSAGGAELAELNEGLSRYFDVREGLVVLQVAPETPAARAGLEPGDVVVAVDGTAVRTARELRDALNRSETGRARLEVVRHDGRRQMDMEWQRPVVFHRTFPAGGN